MFGMPYQDGTPTLIPNFDRSVVSNGVLSAQTTAQFMAANPRADATVTATIAGTISAGDIIPLTVVCGTLPGGSLGFEYTVQTSDTVATVAASIVDLVNSNATAQSVGLSAVTGNTPATSGVITFKWNGPIGNFAILQSSALAPVTITVAGTALTGDTMNVLFSGGPFTSPVIVSANSTTGNTATQQATALKNAINANAQLIAASITATSSLGVVSLSIPGTDEPVNVSAYINPANPNLATVGGTLTVGDVLSITVANAVLPGGSVTVSYTTVAGDTTATMATALFNAINSNIALIAANIVAANGTPSVVSIAYPSNIGAVTFSKNVTGSATETITLSATATETIAVGTTATETVAIANSGVFSGGTGAVFPVKNMTMQYRGTSILLWYGKPKLLDYQLLSAVVSQGIPVV